MAWLEPDVFTAEVAEDAERELETTTMKFSVFTRSYNSFGGNKHFGLIGELLEQELGSYGDDVTEIEITASFAPMRLPKKTLEQMYENYVRGLLDLPRVRNFKTKQRIEIQYRSELSEDDYQRNYGSSTPELISRASAELVRAMHLIDGKLKSKNGFDLERFHSDVNRIINQMPASTDELESLRQKLRAKRVELLQKMDPWELLEIDWTKFHPQARTLLNDVFFWSCTDDFAPHGNDTGADVLADFAKWNKRHTNEPPIAMIPKLFKSWGLGIIDGNCLDETTIRSWLEQRPHDLICFDEAAIAIAFASIKLRGCCDRPTRDAATNAIRREAMHCVTAYRGWDHAEQRLATLGKMTQFLERVPEQA